MYVLIFKDVCFVILGNICKVCFVSMFTLLLLMEDLDTDEIFSFSFALWLLVFIN